ncbi:MAG: tetratricopeptide repeat protein [Pyrinomonadaceae bacterium]
MVNISRLALSTILLAASLAVMAQTAPDPTLLTKANELFQAQDWEKAAQAFEAVSNADPGNARAWYRLGISLHKLGLYERAIVAHQQALKLMPEQNRSLAMYNIGISYAKISDKGKAFEWLTKAIEAGYSPTVPLTTDPDLSALRDDKTRFQTLVELVDKLTKPCLYGAEHKQFDFWIGEWNVQNPQGQQVGQSRIERIENGCIILENWDSGPAGSGKSINFYDANLHKWRQTWADNTGGVSEFSGVFKDGAMRFEGESHRPDGVKVLRRLTFFNFSADRVRQYSEASTDGGKTWNLDYDFTYLRRQ